MGGGRTSSSTALLEWSSPGRALSSWEGGGRDGDSVSGASPCPPHTSGSVGVHPQLVVGLHGLLGETAGHLFHPFPLPPSPQSARRFAVGLLSGGTHQPPSVQRGCAGRGGAGPGSPPGERATSPTHAAASLVPGRGHSIQGRTCGQRDLRHPVAKRLDSASPRGARGLGGAVILRAGPRSPPCWRPSGSLFPEKWPLKVVAF